ncbi:MAG: glycosyltransferase [Gemmatimonadetes bacterium]|nr:MAG: glycosyltransferase [Gemmatimonadota bacterium]
MHIVFVHYYYDEDLASYRDLFARYQTTVDWANMMRDSGAQVTVAHRYRETVYLEKEGVTYAFIADPFGGRLRGYQLPVAMHRYIAALKPDIIHINGLIFPYQTMALKQQLPNVPVVVQHHAEKPFHGWRRWLQRWGLRQVDAFFFTGTGMVAPYQEARIIAHSTPVYAVLENSTHFRYAERAPNRRISHLSGNPIFLWVGNLTENKDPLTVLEGFDRLLADQPAAHLYMIYKDETLLKPVHALIDRSPRLTRAVTLLGHIQHNQMECYYNSADFFVLGSHYEGSGYALIEALACGVIPIVTRIPSFRWILQNHGYLWTPGDPNSFQDAAKRALRRSISEDSRQIARYFQSQLSFSQLGQTVTRIYQHLIQHG